MVARDVPRLNAGVGHQGQRVRPLWSGASAGDIVELSRGFSEAPIVGDSTMDRGRYESDPTVGPCVLVRDHVYQMGA